ncbi:uncharacterized protein PFL1_01288 [Pseudozyma flocculosa PF-1]|uniref:CHRD domain-containing protein n=1 Tax=Pseudozyma flocculosa TaxID=84751 RepID=A0A5C3EX39_9BASI|nr:uncharacterized protein PFL1_01288 [Pseudozyma flocculosa PF-1]EPQ31099.1 hypothetical protein PFL1_01288 [Pseudozyma flocculosa PF-1]SPO35957.1 uncharacterized protein PSFLO_01428 [Pseudozyma flocculosa]
MKVALSSALIALSLTLVAAPIEVAEATPILDKLADKIGRFVSKPRSFTSAIYARATPDQIVTSTGARPAGQANALGRYNVYLDSKSDTVCWDILLEGVTGEYMSPARTATHIHQAPRGAAGPPRIAFPNPEFVKTLAGKEIRQSKGCMKGPFVTGIKAPAGDPNGVDTGSASGFRVGDIEANVANFFGDAHTKQFPDGAVRGQFIPSERPVKAPREFTSVLRTRASPDQVVNPSGTVGVGQPGAKGTFEFKINTHHDILCYRIEVSGVTGDYLSPAKTATHVHQAARGANGPPRLAFPNPQPAWWAWNKKTAKRTSSGCIKGPFTTGLVGADGSDTGSQSGFSLQQLQDNPSAFFADTHTEAFSAGAVRGQLERVK